MSTKTEKAYYRGHSLATGQRYTSGGQRVLVNQQGRHPVNFTTKVSPSWTQNAGLGGVKSNGHQLVRRGYK